MFANNDDKIPEKRITYGQDVLIERIRACGYKGDAEGLCFGTSHMMQQAFFADELDYFNRRMDFIKNIPVDLFRPNAKDEFIRWTINNLKYHSTFLIEVLKKCLPDLNDINLESVINALNDHQKQRDFILTPDVSKIVAEFIYWETRALFEGIELYFQAKEYPQIFNQENIPKTQLDNPDIVSSIVFPKKLEEDDLKLNKEDDLKPNKEDDLKLNKEDDLKLNKEDDLKLNKEDDLKLNKEDDLKPNEEDDLKPNKLNKIGFVYTAQSLTELNYYLNKITNFKLEEKINIIFVSAGHAISISYDPVSKKCYFGDPNQLPIREVSTEKLGQDIFEAFWEESNGNIVYEMTVNSQKHNENDSLIIKNWIDEVNLFTTNNLSANVKKISHDKASLFFTAIENNDLVLIKMIKDKIDSEDFKLVIEATNTKDETPLHLAVKYGQTEMVEFLINSSAPINAQDKTGIAPLHCAIANNNFECAKLLIANKADLGSKTYKGNFTPLYFALKPKRFNILKQILDIKPSFGNLSEPKVKKILALSLLSSDTSVETFKYLIDFNLKQKFIEKFDVNFKVTEDYTMLSLAVKFKNIDMVRFLIEEGADPTITNEYNNNALDIAYKNNVPEIIDLLEKAFPNLKANVNTKIPSVEVVNLDFDLDFDLDLGINTIINTKNDSPLPTTICLKYNKNKYSNQFKLELDKLNHHQDTKDTNNILNKFRLFVNETFSTPAQITKLFEKFSTDMLNYIEENVLQKKSSQLAPLDINILTHSLFDPKKLSIVGMQYYRSLIESEPNLNMNKKRNTIIANKLSIATILFLQEIFDTMTGTFFYFI